MENKIKQRIKELRIDLKKYHLPYKDEERYYSKKGAIKTVDLLMEYIDNMEFSSDEDMIWIQAKIRAFEEVLEMLKK